MIQTLVNHIALIYELNLDKTLSHRPRYSWENDILTKKNILTLKSNTKSNQI